MLQPFESVLVTQVPPLRAPILQEISQEVSAAWLRSKCRIRHVVVVLGGFTVILGVEQIIGKLGTFEGERCDKSRNGGQMYHRLLLNQ